LDLIYKLQELYANESRLRRKLHNQVMELQGNIRVFCRARPISRLEREQGGDLGSSVASFPDEDMIVMDTPRKMEDFEFEKVFGPDSHQTQVASQVLAGT
jgi:kinesin family protein C2/C3